MTFRTSAIAPNKGSMVLCVLGIRPATNIIPAVSVSGGGMAWREFIRVTSQGAEMVLVIFAAYAHHPVQNDFLEVTIGEAVSVLWAVDEIPNVPTSPQNRMAIRRISGVDQIVTVAFTTTGTSQPFPDTTLSTSRSWCAWFRNHTGAPTIGTPWVSLADVTDAQGRLTTEMALGAVTENTTTYGASAATLGIMLEVLSGDAGHQSAVVGVTYSQAIEATIGSEA